MFTKSTPFLLLATITVFVLLILIFLCYGDTFGYENFASFGTFIGGVITPIAVLVAGLTLVRSSETHNKEMERITNESTATDIVKTLNKMDNDLQNLLKDRAQFKIPVNGITREYSVTDVIYLLADRIDLIYLIPEVPEDEQANSIFGEEAIPLMALYGTVAIRIRAIREYSESHARMSKHNAICGYYADRYQYATKRLNARGYPIDVWVPKDCNGLSN